MKSSNRLLHALYGFWPQLPLGLLMILSGGINVLTASMAGSSPLVLSNILSEQFADVLMSSDALAQQSSIAVLGTSAQLVFGAGLVTTGLGLFWRIRIAWVFAILLLVVTIGINVAKGHFNASLIVPVVVLLALILYGSHFQRRTAWGNSLLSLMGVILVLVYGTLGIYLFGNEFDPEITTWLTALYFLVETLSTTGYGDYHPTTPLTQGFMISVWVVGLGVFATALASFASSSFTRHMTSLLTREGASGMEKDHVILVGNGLVATNTAYELRRRKIPFVQLVEPDREPPLADQAVITGDPSDNNILRKAGIARARMLIAAEDDDGSNAFVCLAAKDVNPQLRVLVVASSRQSIHRLKLARADVVFAPVEVGTRLLANLVEGTELPPEFDDLMTLGDLEK